MHVATGAAGGALTRSRAGAIGLGLVLHALGDRIPHQDIRSRRFEIQSGVACALAASAPDIEHVVRLPRPGGRKLFPSHRIPGWHQAGGVPAWAQLLVAGTIVGYLLGSRR